MGHSLMSDPQTAAGPLIHGVPLALWVAIVIGLLSPLVALVGVLIANRSARSLLSKQLTHEAEQRDRERKMSLRRDVYLEAAAALTRLQALIGSASSLEHDHKSVLADFVDGQAKLVKVHIVGSEATVGCRNTGRASRSRR